MAKRTVVAVDDGYAGIKASAGGKFVQFDALHQPWRGVGRAYPVGGGSIVFVDREHAFGARRTPAVGYHGGELNAAAVAEACYRLGVSGPVDLICGLPLADHTSEATKEAKRTAMSSLPRPEGEESISVKSVTIWPQAAAVVAGEGIEGRFLTLDLGSETADFATGQVSDGRPVFDIMETHDLGVWNAIRRMAQTERLTDLGDAACLGAWIDGTVKDCGQVVPVGGGRGEARVWYASEVVSRLDNFPGPRALDHVLLCGGGAMVQDVADSVKARYPQARVVEAPLLANLHGFEAAGVAR